MKTITGNLLEIPSGIILHQVNCRGVTGGLAGTLRRKFPVQFESYINGCALFGPHHTAGNALIGGALLQPYIAHVFGQIEPGQNTEMTLVARALRDLSEQITCGHKLSGLAVFAPYKMGCGLGGGDWPKYLALLESIFPEITIIQRPEDARHE